MTEVEKTEELRYRGGEQRDREQNADAEIEESINADSPNVDRAMDSGYQKNKQSAQKEAELLFPQMESSGEFFEHKGRTAKLKQSLKNHSPLRFSLNTSALGAVRREAGDTYIKRYYRGKGIRSSLMPETSEREGSRLLSGADQLTNQAIKIDNYDFFLKHNKSIRTNLARVMLAKLDLDMNSKATLEDILSSKEWSEASGTEVFNELKNRLRTAGREKEEAYAPIFKILKEAEKVAIQWETYKEAKLSKQKAILEEIKEQHDPLKPIEDEVTYQRTEILLRNLKDSIYHRNSSKETLEEVLSKITLDSHTKGSMVEYAYPTNIRKDASELLQILLSPEVAQSNIAKANAKAFLEEKQQYEEEKKLFISTHNNMSKKATEATERIAYESKEFPMYILAYLTDRDYYLNNIPKEERKIAQKEIEESIRSELEKLLPAGTDTKAFVLGLKKRLKASKSDIEWVYDPSKDTFDDQRQYAMWESTRMHNTAAEVLKESIYLELFNTENQELHDKYFDKKAQKEILTVATDKTLSKLKPNMDKVNDIHNTISLLTRSTVGDLSGSDVDALLDDALFSHSTVLNAKERGGLKRFTKEITDTTKVLKSEEIIGSPKLKEMEESVQEMHMINLSNAILSRLRPDKSDNLIKRGIANIGRNFFQNNRALYQMEQCHNAAMNPTTSVETTPSLSKACLEKLKQAFEKDGESRKKEGLEGWIGIIAFGAAPEKASLVSRASYDNLENLINDTNKDILADKEYLSMSKNAEERQAREMNIIGDDGDIANHMISSSHAKELEDKIEQEALVRQLINNPIQIEKYLFDDEDPLLEEIKTLGEGKEDEQRALLAKEEQTLHSLTDKQLEAQRKALKSDTQAPLAVLQENLNALEEREKSIKEESSELYKKYKESNNEEERKALSREITELLSSLDKTKESIVGLKESLEAKEVLEKLDDEVEQSKERIALLKASLLDPSHQSNLVFTPKFGRKTEVDFSNISGKEIEELVERFGEHKERIDAKLIENRKGDRDPKEEKRLLLERDRVTRTIGSLTAQALKDKELLAEGISQSLKRENDIFIPKEKIKEGLDKNGLADWLIAFIIQQATHLTEAQKNTMRSTLFDTSLAIKKTNKVEEEGLLDIKDANILSSLAKAISSSEVAEKLNKYNDMYISYEEIEGGKESMLQNAKGHLGHLVKRAGDLNKKIDSSMNEKEKAAYRKELFATISILEEDFGDRGGNFERYKTIATSSLKDGKKKMDGNTAIHQKERMQRRQR